jgi:NAD(P)-dependent dehydrogenase (short-subunit alcohol dehydrogenase family)
VTSATSSFDWLGLSGRVCVVTGAGGGIGRAIAINLARAGARLALLDLDEATLGETCSAIGDVGGNALAIVCDMARAEDIEAAATRSREGLGICAALVNTAALLRSGPLETLRLEEWNLLLSVNLTGYFLASQAFGRQMRARGGGSIVHIASIAASHAQGNSGAYSVSKAGIVMLSRQLATEWGPLGIRSNVVSPGMILTPLSESFYDTPGVTERRSEAIPAGRIGMPQDIADTVLFLLSDRATYITGDELTVDGGYVRNLMNLIPRPGFENATMGKQL